MLSSKLKCLKDLSAVTTLLLRIVLSWCTCYLFSECYVYGFMIDISDIEAAFFISKNFSDSLVVVILKDDKTLIICSVSEIILMNYKNIYIYMPGAAILILCMFVLFKNRTQKPDRGADGALVSPGETMPGFLCDEEWRPELVKREPLHKCTQLFLSFIDQIE